MKRRTLTITEARRTAQKKVTGFKRAYKSISPLADHLLTDEDKQCFHEGVSFHIDLAKQCLSYLKGTRSEPVSIPFEGDSTIEVDTHGGAYGLIGVFETAIISSFVPLLECIRDAVADEYKTLVSKETVLDGEFWESWDKLSPHEQKPEKIETLDQCLATLRVDKITTSPFDEPQIWKNNDGSDRVVNAISYEDSSFQWHLKDIDDVLRVIDALDFLESYINQSEEQA